MTLHAKELLEEFDKVTKAAKQEGFLPPSYEIIGTIIEEKGTFNIMDANGRKLLNKNYPSLKRMLNDLADNM